MFWNITIELIRLDKLCAQLAEDNGFNSSDLNWNDTQTTVPPPRESDCDWLAGAVGLQESGCSWLNVSNATVGPMFEQFQYYSEWYGITIIGGLGIIGNIITMGLIDCDAVMRCLTKALILILLVMEILFLGLSITFVQLRHVFTDLGQRVEVMAYVTMAMSYTQMAASWLTYALATDAYRAIRYFQKPSKLPQLKNARWHVVLIFLGALVFHAAYVPHIRTVLYQVDPGMYEACNQPIVKQWEFHKNNKIPSDLYYVLYYALLYLLVVYFVPFYAVACRDKDIIDTLHTMQEKNNVPENGFSTAETALVVSVICNVHLVCTVPKLAMLIFKLFDYVLLYVRESHVFFRYANVLANDFVVLKSGLYLPVTLLYLKRVAEKVYQRTCAKCVKCVESARHKTTTITITVDEV